jgi:hypothetical protein
MINFSEVEDTQFRVSRTISLCLIMRQLYRQCQQQLFFSDSRRFRHSTPCTFELYPDP